MSRTRVLRVSALNLIMHPHSSSRYLKLLVAAQRGRHNAKYHGDRRAIIGHVSEPSGAGSRRELSGTIVTFADIDGEEDWFNLKTRKTADESEIDEVVLPPHLKPSMRRFDFTFFPATHRLFYESRNEHGKTLGPTSAQRLFERILNADDLTREFGPVDVIVVPTHDALDRILSLPSLQRLTINIKRPNPDDGADLEREVMKRLEEQNASEHQGELKAIPGKSLEPSEEFRALARVAAANGFVTGHGRDESGKVVDRSTIDRPLIESVYYSPDKELKTDVLKRKARELLARVLG